MRQVCNQRGQTRRAAPDPLSARAPVALGAPCWLLRAPPSFVKRRGGWRCEVTPDGQRAESERTERRLHGQRCTVGRLPPPLEPCMVGRHHRPHTNALTVVVVVVDGGGDDGDDSREKKNAAPLHSHAGRCSRLLSDSPPLFAAQVKQEGAKSNRNTPSLATARTARLRGSADEMNAVVAHRAVSRRFWVGASPALVLFCHLRCFNFFRTRSAIRKDGAPTERSSSVGGGSQSQSIGAHPSRFDSHGTAAICNAADAVPTTATQKRTE